MGDVRVERVLVGLPVCCLVVMVGAAVAGVWLTAVGTAFSAAAVALTLRSRRSGRRG